MDAGIKKVSIYISAILSAMSALVACQSGDDAQNALEKSNPEKAVYCMELLEIKLDVETADRECFGESYFRHAPHVPDGRDAVISFFAEMAGWSHCCLRVRNLQWLVVSNEVLGASY